MANHPHKTLLEIIAAILSDGLVTCEDVWENEIEPLECFEGITFSSLSSMPKIVL